MTLTEITSPSDLKSFLTKTPPLHNVICFSAHWCGPCKASKPDLMAMAQSYEQDTSMEVNFGIVYEDVLGEALHSIYNIQAFPTYVLFKGEEELGRVQGVNFDGIRKLIEKFECKKSLGEGHALGSGERSEEDIRMARENRLKSLEDNLKKSTATPMEIDKKEEKNEDQKMISIEKTDASTRVSKLDSTAIEQLTSTMGFSTLRSQKGLLNSDGTVEGAIEWLCAHQDDPDIDDPISSVETSTARPEEKKAGLSAQSYKCNECDKNLSNMANLELHANKTGHADFSESTEMVIPLTAEQKENKIAEIKELLKSKRNEREEQEKEDNVERERQRRNMGKEKSKTREEMDRDALKRDAQLRRKEKLDAKRQRESIRAELAKDKAERAANAGKLHSKLGVGGYNPDAVQYDKTDSINDDSNMNIDDADKKQVKKEFSPNPKNIDDYIKKISAYRAGGDGGKCLKVLHIYIRNIVDNPADDKFQRINIENKAYKSKVKPFIGSKALLQACGFEKSDNVEENALILKSNRLDLEFLKDVKVKLETAMKHYG